MGEPSREALAGLLRGRVSPSLRSEILAHDAALRAELDRARGPAVDVGVSHWPGCWREHHGCAVAEVERLAEAQRDHDAAWAAVGDAREGTLPEAVAALVERAVRWRDERDEARRHGDILHSLIEGRLSRDAERPYAEGQPMPFSLALACRQFAAVLKDTPEAENYVQMEWREAGEEQAYRLVVQYADGRSPHERALEAERERDDARAALAECFRLSGADPDGNEDWRLAPHAVAEVRRLRTESDEADAEVLRLTDLLRRAREYVEPGDLADRIAEALGEPVSDADEFAPAALEAAIRRECERVGIPAPGEWRSGSRERRFWLGLDVAASVSPIGWWAWRPHLMEPIGEGPETGPAGRLAADRALLAWLRAQPDGGGA